MHIIKIMDGFMSCAAKKLRTNVTCTEITGTWLSCLQWFEKDSRC